MYNWFIMKKYYNSIDAENTNNIQEVNIDSDTINVEPKYTIIHCIYRLILDCTNKIKQFLLYYKIIQGIGLAIFTIILSCIVVITLGIWFIAINYVLENTLVFLFGRDVYNKNFPVCSNTEYIGKNCYVSTNTYCS